MSLSFPTAPTVGQIYHGLIWDGTKWASPQGPAGLANVVLEASMTANQTGLTTSAWQQAKYNTVITDKQTAYSPATGFFTPRQAGLYLVTATLGVWCGINIRTGIAIVKNGSLSGPETQTSSWVNGGVGNTFPLSVSALINCNGTTDTISVWGYTGSDTQFYAGSNLSNVAATNMVASLLQVGPQGPAGQGAGPGSRVLLGTASVATTAPVATVDFPTVFTTAYDLFEYEFFNVSVSAAAAVSGVFGDGTNWITGAGYYSYGGFWSSSNNTSSLGGGTFTGLSLGFGEAVGNQWVTNGWGKIPAPWATDRAKTCSCDGQVLQTSGMTLFGLANYLNSGYAGYLTTPIKGIRFLPASGNFTRGVFSIYGITPGSQRAS